MVTQYPIRNIPLRTDNEGSHHPNKGWPGNQLTLHAAFPGWDIILRRCLFVYIIYPACMGSSPARIHPSGAVFLTGIYKYRRLATRLEPQSQCFRTRWLRWPGPCWRKTRSDPLVCSHMTMIVIASQLCMYHKRRIHKWVHLGNLVDPIYTKICIYKHTLRA